MEKALKNKTVHTINRKIFSAFSLIGIITSITGGMILSLSGLFLSIIKYFENENFHGLESLLIVAAFILFTIAAHLLDLIERAKRINLSDRFNSR